MIVTGSSEVLATAFCAALGLQGIHLVGSRFIAAARGWTVGEHCVGNRKIGLLATAGVTPPWDVVYTDSASDLPLLQLAERRCVVNPKRSTLHALNRHLGKDFEVIRWT